MATETKTREARAQIPPAGVRATAGFRASEVKLAKVEKVGEYLAATVTLTVTALEPTDLHQLGRLIQAGPMDVELLSCQLNMGL